MAGLKIRMRSAPIHKVSDCACYGFERWLTGQKLTKAELERLLAEWRSIPNQNPCQLFPVSARWHFLPRLTHPLANPPEIPHAPFRISWEIVEALLKFYEQLLKTDYRIIITNSSRSNIEQLAVHYYIHKMVGNAIQSMGLFTTSLAALPPGETAEFNTANCLEMADKYVITCVHEGTVNTFQEDIAELNAREREKFGTVDFCGDSLEFYLADG